MNEVPALTNFTDLIRPGGLLAATLVLATVWALGRVIARLVDRLGSRFTDRRLAIQQAGTLTRFVLYIAGSSAALVMAIRFSDEMVLALGGTIAVTVGFALKDLAASVVAGVILLIDRPFQVGDRVSFAGYYGEITSLGLRAVRLTTLDDNVVTIPNNKFLTEAVASGNAGALDMLIQMDFYVGIDQEIMQAKRIVGDAITSSRYAYLKKPWVVLVNQVNLENVFAVRLRAKVYVLDVRYEKALETDVTERVLEGFGRANIQPPALLVRQMSGMSGDTIRNAGVLESA